MFSYSGPPLTLDAPLAPLKKLGCSFQLIIDGNTNAILRRGVVVAPDSSTPMWFDDMSFVGGFTTDKQRLFSIEACIPESLVCRVTIVGVPEECFHKWKTERVVECVRQSCGEAVRVNKPKKDHPIDSKVIKRNVGRPKVKIELRAPKEKRIDLQDVPIDLDDVGIYEEIASDEISAEPQCVLTYSTCLSYLRAAQNDLLERLQTKVNPTATNSTSNTTSFIAKKGLWPFFE